MYNSKGHVNSVYFGKQEMVFTNFRYTTDAWWTHPSNRIWCGKRRRKTNTRSDFFHQPIHLSIWKKLYITFECLKKSKIEDLSQLLLQQKDIFRDEKNKKNEQRRFKKNWMLTISKQVVKITISHNWISSHYRSLLKKDFHLKVINRSSTFKFWKR